MLKLVALVLAAWVCSGNCQWMLLEMEDTYQSTDYVYSCVTKYSGSVRSKLASGCFTHVPGICDYDLAQNKFFCVAYNGTGIQLLRFSVNYFTGTDKTTDISYITNTRPKDIAVDWYNDKFYVIYDNLMVGPLAHQQHAIKLGNVISRDKVAAVTKEPRTIMRRVRVDPYRRLLFVLASFEANERGKSNNIYILSSNLEGNNVKTIIKKPFNHIYVTFSVDIGEMKIHLTYDKHLYTYNYEGSLIKQYEIPNHVIDISAYGNKVYIYNQIGSNDNFQVNMYILDQNNTEVVTFPMEKYSPYLNFTRFKVIDPLVQRKKENGEFVCDRKDCPNFCEVRPTGDLCIRDDTKNRIKNQFKGDLRPDILLYGGNMACILHYTDEDTIKRCLLIDNDNDTIIDLHLTDGFMYYIDTYYGSSQLKRMAFNFTLNGNFIKSFDPRGIDIDFDVNTINGMNIDWVKNDIYVFGDDRKNIMRGKLYSENEFIFISGIWFSTRVEYHKKYFHKDGYNDYTVTAVQVDPYREIVFAQVTFRNKVSEEQKYVLFEVGNYEEVKGEQAFKDTKFYVDINEMKLYILDHRNLHIYNYEGKLLNTLKIAVTANDFVVFMNVMYATVIGDTGVIKIPLSKTNLPRESYQVQYHGMNKNLPLKIKLLDARVQRRMENGTYVCDKKDCPYLCEVRSSGDVCICPKDKAKRRDGITCYECGQSNLTSLILKPTIVKGNSSELRNFPWHTVLYKLNDTNLWDAVCGGTLVSSRAVLTAAHCVTTVCLNCEPSALKTEQLKVALGKIQQSWYINEPHGQRFEVAEIRVTKWYKGSSANFANDIALLLLKSTVSFNEYIMPACLDYSLNQLPPHETLVGYVAGFGKTEECVGICANAQKSDVLKYTKARVLSYTKCFEASNSIDPTLFHRLTSDKFCIGNGSESAVQQGDSGGGLTLEYHGLHYVTGVVSIKLLKIDGNKFKYSFGAFTNVSKHIDWVKKNLPEDE